MQDKIKSENYSSLGGINTKVSTYEVNKTEFLDLVNFDFTKPGSLTKRYGSTHYVGATVSGRITGVYEFERLSGASAVIVSANTNIYNLSAGSFSVFKSSLQNGAIFDFVTFVDRLFACNGTDFFKYDLSTVTNYSLPPGYTHTISTGSTGVGTMNGVYQYAYGYLNDRGFLGPVSPSITLSVTNVFATALSGFTTPTGYGITAIAVYRTGAGLSDLFRVGFHPVGGATFVDTNLSLGVAAPEYTWFTMAPKYMEIFNNQLFMAGFSSQLSTVWFSDIGEPEGVKANYSFEVRTNDGDKITGLKAYNGALMVFKERSFHVLTGDNPENFLLREVSDQYGSVSNNAIVVYENHLAFLDRKGVIKYNGANIDILSLRIEPTMLDMNINAAKENATAIHNRLRNELWFGIPCNGATYNNCTIVYDYTVNAWTKFEGFNPSVLSVFKGSLSKSTAGFGSYSGAVFNFGYSLMSDAGTAMTCLIKTRYLADVGQSVTKQFRRLYLDVDAVTGTTSTISIRLFPDYGVTASVTRTMYQNPFQSRIDFGIPAKSLSAEISNTSTTDSIRINGFTIEYRLQRMV